MNNNRLRRALTTLGLILSIGFANLAAAAQMGELRTFSSLGEPLNAAVGLWLKPAEKNQALRVKVTPDIYYRGNSALTELVKSFNAHVQYTESGRPFVHIKSSLPINEPAIAFRVKVYVGDMALIRNYSLALTPRVTPRAETTTAATPDASTSKAAPRATRSASMPREPITGTQYTVASGDSLWAIARRLNTGAKSEIANIAQRIFEANPQAFIAGDQNKLKLGATLTIPDAPSHATFESEPVSAVAETETAIAEPVTVTSTATTDPVVTESISTPAPADPIINMAPVTPVAEPAAPVEDRRPLTWQERKPDVAAQLEALRVRYAALKARYGDTQTSAPSAAADTEASSAESMALLQAGDNSPTVAKEPLATPQQEPELSVTSAPNRAPEALQTNVQGGVQMSGAAAFVDSILNSTIFQMIVGGLALVVLAVVLSFVLLRSFKVLRSRRAENAYLELEENRKAEVARKAQSRIEMESEVQRMFDERDGENTPSSDASDGASSLEPSADTAADNQDAEIDLNIAHGRYSEAEKLLRDVIEQSPRNYSAKLRLIEVYYMTERIEEFCGLAEDLHQNHRPDMADEEWRRVIRMGKIIAPNEPPFSGPRAVHSSPNDAS